MNGLALRPPSTCISVCSGVGGLDLGLHAALPDLVPVVYIERETFAASVLVARMEEARLPPAPVWDDVSTFDGRPLVGLVDLVAGGTPCQDLSLAGRRRGLDGERSRLFFEHVRVARECEAPFFFWENVAGATRTVPLVAEHLHASGYSAIVWCVLRARDVGAPHERARIFLLAYSECHALRQQPGWGGRKDWACAPQPRLAGADVADTDKHRRQGERRGDLLHGERAAFGNDAHRRGCAGTEVDVADTCLSGLEERRALGGDGEAKRSPALRNCLGVFPPGRDDRGAWSRVLAVRPELAPARAQPRLRGLAHGVGAGVELCVCPREDRLRATGNGVVPQQAERAWHTLWGALCRRLIEGQQP